MEIKDFVRPTQIVRSVMRSHGKLSYEIYTNKYDKCRTVKCYHRGSPLEITGDIRTALIKAGVKSFGIKTITASHWVSPNGDLQSLIVRIPNTEQ